MDSLKAIYKILERLDKAQDEDRPDFKDISAKSLGISEKRWTNVLLMMKDARLVDGITVNGPFGQNCEYMIIIDNAKITLYGLKWLDENSATNKILKAAKEIKDLIPGI